MKFFIFVSGLLLSSSLRAEPTAQNDLLQRSLEAECKESWCQGAYAVNFRRVLPNPRKEEVLVQLSLRNSARVKKAQGDAQFDAQIDQDTFTATCRIKGISGEPLEADTKRPVPALRDGLGACLEHLAARLDLILD